MRAIAAGVLLTLSLLLNASPRALHAQSGAAGFRVAPAHDSTESQPRIISDHAGGAFVGFIGDFNAFYVARLRPDATPDPAWTALKVSKVQILYPSGTRFAWLGSETIVAFSDQYFGNDGGQIPPAKTSTRRV